MTKDRQPHKNDPCPERGPALSHVRDGSRECVFCGVITADDRKIGPRRPRRRREEVEVEFTDDEVRRLEFLRYLRRAGRI